MRSPVQQIHYLAAQIKKVLHLAADDLQEQISI